MISAVRFGSAILLAVSCILFCVALALNVASVLRYPPAQSLKDTVIMFPTIAVMFVTVLSMIRIQRDTPQRKSWQILWAVCPPWAKKVYYGLFAYGLVIWMMLANAQYKTGRSPTPLPFLSIFAVIVCYNAAMTFYTLWRKTKLLTGHFCANGHRVSALDKFCPQCGVAL